MLEEVVHFSIYKYLAAGRAADTSQDDNAVCDSSIHGRDIQRGRSDAIPPVSFVLGCIACSFTRVTVYVTIRGFKGTYSQLINPRIE